MFGRLRLQNRMTLWYTLLTFIAVAAFAAALYWMTDYVLGEMLEQDARLLMKQITAQIEEEHGLLTYENEVPISANTMFFITEEDGSELASYGDDITVFDGIAMEPGVFQTAQGGAERWLLLDSGVITVEHARLRVRVACSMATDDRVLSVMRWAFFISIPIIVLFSALGGLFIARRSLKPIRQIIHSAEIIAAGDFAARVPAAPARDELGELTDTLNHMLQSVEAALNREKRFTSDASHELRTPVAVIRAYAESLRAQENLTPEDAGALDTVLAECARMQKIIAQLLTITRVEEGRYPVCFETVDLHAAAQGVAETLSGLCAEKG
ncbi:MAG: histidine kinase dimerization/phospho-acceptor domain-containing protein, partial [Eubacteriales bacterium]|nr:histidine kinase dimerization/phospho-acceptor domain-containing protein [Eubacteriales bacterium]